MAHFSKINSNNIVTEVLVIPNEQEHRGQEYINSDLGIEGTWIQTSYNSNFRANYGYIGSTYDAINDVFITPKPIGLMDYVLDPITFKWDFEYPMPKDGKLYQWHPDTKIWTVIEETPTT